MDRGSGLVLNLTLEMFILFGFSAYCCFSTLDMESLEYLQNMKYRVYMLFLDVDLAAIMAPSEVRMHTSVHN